MCPDPPGTSRSEDLEAPCGPWTPSGGARAPCGRPPRGGKKSLSTPVAGVTPGTSPSSLANKQHGHESVPRPVHFLRLHSRHRHRADVWRSAGGGRTLNARWRGHPGTWPPRHSLTPASGLKHQHEPSSVTSGRGSWASRAGPLDGTGHASGGPHPLCGVHASPALAVWLALVPHGRSVNLGDSERCSGGRPGLASCEHLVTLSPTDSYTAWLRVKMPYSALSVGSSTPNARLQHTRPHGARHVLPTLRALAGTAALGRAAVLSGGLTNRKHEREKLHIFIWGHEYVSPSR